MSITELPFRDRADAGRRLADQLLHLQTGNPIVLALPRGGVPVGYEVAKALRAPLEPLLVRKIGAPGHRELGIGAVVDGRDPQVVLNEDLVAELGVPSAYIEEETRRELQEIERRSARCLGGRRAVDVAGRTAIVVDDGIATGGTVRAALQGVSRAHTATLVLGRTGHPGHGTTQSTLKIVRLRSGTPARHGEATPSSNPDLPSEP